MKKFINLKKLGRFFIALSEKNEKDMRQSVLLVDGSFILPNNFALIIKDVEEKFKNAKLTILTFKDKERFIRDNFPDIEIIVPENRIEPKRYWLAVRLLSLLRKNFKFIVLSSLDISPVLTSLIFARCPILLHNRWLEWYILRQRTLADVLHRVKSVDRNRRKIRKGIRGVIKSFGRFFFILCGVKEENIKSRILIVDNGYAETGYILVALQKTEKIFINPDITLLTLPQRKQYFINVLAHMKLVVLGENNNRNSLAGQMYKMRKNKFDYLILTALDAGTVLTSFLFFRTAVLLYNQWQQWWDLKFKNIPLYFKGIFSFLAMVPALAYLIITTSFILLRTKFRLGLVNLKAIFGR